VPLEILIVGAGAGHQVAALLGELDRDQETRVEVVPDLDTLDARQAPAALVLAVPGDSTNPVQPDRFCSSADVMLALEGPAAVASTVERLWESRLAVFARNLAQHRFAMSEGAPQLRVWDPTWSTTADRLMTRLAHSTQHLHGAQGFSWEHIGSTSVPGLAAKPIIDLQLGVPSLDHLVGLEQALMPAGFVDVAPLAPDSPGVLRDTPRGATSDSDPRWDKRLFASADPGQRAILHVRQIGSPWWRYTLRFRDLLRTDPDLRHEYERVKGQLTETHSEDTNYDGYTVAKATFFDAIQARLDAENERNTGTKPS
jgi:GrpB-like predicted nucleotidyltransferase (UPF0157 family)